MKSKILILIGAFLVCMAGCSHGNLTAEEKPLEGKWFCMGEDYSFSWVLTSDHRFGQAMQLRDPVPSDDTTWKVVDGELIISIRQNDGRITSDHCSFVINGNEMDLVRKEINAKQHFTRR